MRHLEREEWRGGADSAADPTQRTATQSATAAQTRRTTRGQHSGPGTEADDQGKEKQRDKRGQATTQRAADAPFKSAVPCKAISKTQSRSTHTRRAGDRIIAQKSRLHLDTK